jgi:uncharacterized protein
VEALGTALFTAFGLLLVMEGLMPFIAPAAWRETFRKAIELKDGQLRMGGLIAIGAGLLILMVSI